MVGVRRLNSFRHTVSAWGREVGLKLEEVKTLLRHENLAATSEVYGDLGMEAKRLHVRPHYSCDATHLRSGPKFVGGCLLQPVSFAKCFERDVQSDCVSELETVSHRFRRREYSNGDAVEGMFTNPKTNMDGSSHCNSSWKGDWLNQDLDGFWMATWCASRFWSAHTARCVHEAPRAYRCSTT